MSTRHKQILIVEHPVKPRAHQLAMACYRHLDKRCSKGEVIAHRPCIQYLLDPVYMSAQVLFGINKTRHAFVKDDPTWELHGQPEFFGNTPSAVYEDIIENQSSMFLGRIGARRAKLNKEYNVFVYYDIDNNNCENIVPMCIEMGVDNVSLISFGKSNIIPYLQDMMQTKSMKMIELLDTEDYSLTNALIRGTMMKFYGIEDFE